MGLPPYTHPRNSFDYDNYLSYLNSKAWAELRNKRIELDGYKCAICGNPNSLEVHHLIYPTVLGTESTNHLVTLCSTCHMLIEKRKKLSDNRGAKRWYSNITVQFNFADYEQWEEYREKFKELFQEEDDNGFMIATFICDTEDYKRRGRASIRDISKAIEMFPELEWIIESSY